MRIAAVATSTPKMSAYTPTTFTRLSVTAWGRRKISTARKMDHAPAAAQAPSSLEHPPGLHDCFAALVGEREPETLGSELEARARCSYPFEGDAVRLATAGRKSDKITQAVAEKVVQDAVESAAVRDLDAVERAAISTAIRPANLEEHALPRNRQVRAEPDCSPGTTARPIEIPRDPPTGYRSASEYRTRLGRCPRSLRGFGRRDKSRS